MPIPSDTLTYDVDKIARYQANPRYDYNRELLQVPSDWWNDLIKRVANLLQSLFHNIDGQKAAPIVVWSLVAILGLLLLLFFYFIWKKRPKFFQRDKQVGVPYDVISEAELYDTDFARSLEDALARNDYRAAVRLIYLQTLRITADRGGIEWQIFKTPTEYVRELRPESLRPHFQQLTNIFLRVRYGNYSATPELFERMRILQQHIIGEEGNEQ